MLLEKFLDNTAKWINPDYNAYLGSFNEADIAAGNIVYFSQEEIDQDPDYTRKFTDFLLSMWDKATQFSPYTWAFLHEIGHLETNSTLSDNDDAVDFLIRGTQDGEVYMRLPSERAATEWAIDFAYSHQEEIRTFDKFLLILLSDD